MKNIEEIESNYRVHVGKKGIDGFKGTITFAGWTGTLIVSKGAGWEHVSVAPTRRNVTPSWDEMCIIKDIFWNDDEAVIQIHPPKDQYVNNLGNCLHLWRCYYKDMVLPPSCMVGIRPGQTICELTKEIKKAYELAGETY